MNDKIEKLHLFLEKNIECIRSDGNRGYIPILPEMDLYPDDYLDFAEENINRYTSSNCEKIKIDALISCVSNLKRALDAQLECFFFCFGISSHLKKKNLSLLQKLQFISEIGIFSSRTIERFINLRNKVEHEFKIPLFENIEAFYDLVVALVALLKNSIKDLNWIDIYFDIYNSDDLLVGDFSCSYNIDPLKITYDIRFFIEPFGKNFIDISPEKLKKSNKVKLDAPIGEREAFKYFFRCLLILISFESYTTVEHVKNKIKPNQTKTSP